MEDKKDKGQSISDRIERFEEKHFFTFYLLLASPFVSWFLYQTYLAQADKELSAFSLVLGPIILIIVLLMFKSKGFEKLCYIMIIGGSLGNIFDRIYYSAVPDFIDIYFNNFHWFIFNVADIFISIGVIILISLEFFKKKNV